MGFLKLLEDYNARQALRNAPTQYEYATTISFNPIAQNGDRICVTVYIGFTTTELNNLEFITLDLTRNVQAAISRWAVQFGKGERAASGFAFKWLEERIFSISSLRYKLERINVISITPVRTKAASKPLSTVEAMTVNILTLQELHLYVQSLPQRYPDLHADPDAWEQVQRIIEAKRLELLGD